MVIGKEFRYVLLTSLHTQPSYRFYCFSKPGEERGKNILGMMEKTRTSTGVLKGNTCLIDSLRLPHKPAELTCQLSLKLNQAGKPKHLQHKNVVMNFNPTLRSSEGVSSIWNHS